MSIRNCCIQNILSTHHNDGTLQNQNCIMKDNKYLLLNGFYTLKNGKEKRFKRGWYNKNLKFINPISTSEEEYLNYVTPF